MAMKAQKTQRSDDRCGGVEGVDVMRESESGSVCVCMESSVGITWLGVWLGTGAEQLRGSLRPARFR
jgi:hypothetical protein